MTLAERLKDDRGSLTAAMVIWTPVILVLAAFVVDVGYLISNRDKADNIAEQAARRVADDLNDGMLKSQTAVLRPWLSINLDGGPYVTPPATGTCMTDAQDYIASYNAAVNNPRDTVKLVSCTVTGNPPVPVAGQVQPTIPVVTVQVTIQSNPLFAAIVSSATNTVTGMGTASPVGG